MYYAASRQLTFNPDIYRVGPVIYVVIRCYLGRVCAFKAVAASSFPELNSVTSWPSLAIPLALYDIYVSGNERPSSGGAPTSSL